MILQVLKVQVQIQIPVIDSQIQVPSWSVQLQAQVHVQSRQEKYLSA